MQWWCKTEKLRLHCETGAGGGGYNGIERVGSQKTFCYSDTKQFKSRGIFSGQISLGKVGIGLF